MDTDSDTRDEYALITGASSGIGWATALRLAPERKLILHGRDLDRLAATKDACAQSDAHLIWPCDFCAIEDVADSLTKLLAEKAAAVNCFVHSAGMVKVLPMRSTDCWIAQEMMNVNVISATEVLRVLLSKRTNGQHLRGVVFISSIWARFGARGHGMYCATKGALDALMRALAAELAPEVRVNSVLPGAVQTSMAAEGFSDPEIVENLRRDYPLGTGDVADIAEAVEFLLSERAKWVTGHEMVVDGGRTASMSLKGRAMPE